LLLRFGRLSGGRRLNDETEFFPIFFRNWLIYMPGAAALFFCGGWYVGNTVSGEWIQLTKV
jgi:hypothetical protein